MRQAEARSGNQIIHKQAWYSILYYTILYIHIDREAQKRTEIKHKAQGTLKEKKSKKKPIAIAENRELKFRIWLSVGPLYRGGVGEAGRECKLADGLIRNLN